MRISVRKGNVLLYSQSYRLVARQSVCVGCFRLFVQIAKSAWFEMAMFWKGLLASVAYCILFLERGHTQVVAYCIFLACNSWDSIVFACVCLYACVYIFLRWCAEGLSGIPINGDRIAKVFSGYSSQFTNWGI